MPIVKCAVYDNMSVSSCMYVLFQKGRLRIRSTLFREHIIIYERRTLFMSLLFILIWARAARIVFLSIVNADINETFKNAIARKGYG